MFYYGKKLNSIIIETFSSPLNIKELGNSEDVVEIPWGVLANTHYVNELNELVQIPPLPQKFTKSPHFAKFDAVSKQWLDLRSLDQLKLDKKAEINSQRSSIEFGPFIYNGVKFDGDLNAQRRLTTYISLSKSAIAAQETFTADFILFDNTVVQLTEADFIAIEVTKATQVAQAFSKAAALKQQVDAAQTPEEVAAVVWDAPDVPDVSDVQ